MSLENILQDKTNKMSTVKRNGTLLVKWHFNKAFLSEAISEWNIKCGEYVMNGTVWQLVCYSTFYNQYIASGYYTYKAFHQFFLALYYTQTFYCFCQFFSEAYCQDLVTQASLWHHNGNQDVTKEAAVTMVYDHAFHIGWFEAVLLAFSA